MDGEILFADKICTCPGVEMLLLASGLQPCTAGPVVREVWEGRGEGQPGYFVLLLQAGKKMHRVKYCEYFTKCVCLE